MRTRVRVCDTSESWISEIRYSTRPTSNEQTRLALGASAVERIRRAAPVGAVRLLALIKLPYAHSPISPRLHFATQTDVHHYPEPFIFLVHCPSVPTFGREKTKTRSFKLHPKLFFLLQLPESGSRQPHCFIVPSLKETFLLPGIACPSTFCTQPFTLGTLLHPLLPLVPR